MADDTAHTGPRAIPEDPRMSFARFVQNFEDGNLHEQLSRDLQDMAKAMTDYILEFGGAPKGEISLKFKFKMEKGAVAVDCDKSVKTPQRPKSGAFFFISQDGRLTEDNPRQLSMGFPKSGPRPVA